MPEALFVGRERETDLYKQFLARKTPWVLIITGLGGIGKTTLLHRLADYTLTEPTLSKTGVVTLDFADEELRNDPIKLLDKLTKDTATYCDVQQIDIEFKNDLQQNFDQLAQLSKERIQTGVSEAEDPALREIRRQMRQLATEAFYTQIKTFTLDRLVVMLDTCEWLNEPEGIEVGQWVLNELIPGIHTRIRQKGRQFSVVMVSRIQPRLDVINGQDQRRLTLSMLGKAEVDQYLEQVGMQDSNLRQRVYEVTHGHALCISIIGDYWQNRAEQSHPFTIADLPELELQEISEIALIRFTNERVLRHLKTPFKELTRYGVLLRSFDLPLLKNVFPELLPEPAALERFNQLIRHPYIESRGSYRYAFHELVHEALTEETQKEEPEAWKCYHKRALNYFTTVSPHSPDWYYHLLAYDEKQGLMEWQQAVQEARESGKREYIGALLQAALDKALKLSLAARAEVVFEQGRFNYYGVQWEEALKSYKEALTAFQEMGDDSGQAKVLHCIGDVQRVLARQDDALESYAQALAFFRQAGDQLGEAKCCQAMGDIWRLRNDQDAALQSYEQALNLFRQIANQPEEAKVLEAMGDVQRLRNEQDAALRSYEQALALYQEEKDRLKRAKVLKAKGDVHRLKQDQGAALESYTQALALFGELKEPVEEANVRRAMEEMQQPQSEQELLLKSNGLTNDGKKENEEEDEEKRRRLLGLPLLGALASEGQAPVANVPEVQGTPQAGGVPRVEGGSAPQHIHSSPAHLYHDASSALHPRATSPQATAPQGIGQRRAHWHAGARTVRGGWLTIAVTTVVIIAGVVSALAFLLPASISLSGSSTVNSGGTLHLHGVGFLPGSRVTLTLDNGLPLTVVAPGASEEASGGGTVDASMLQVLMADQSTSSGQTIQVGLSGTFDVALDVSQNWSLGAHTIHATEYFFSLDVQSVELTFQIEPKAAQLTVTPAGLDFGLLKQGSKVTKTVTVSDTGQQPLSWEANVGTANWLTLDSSAGTIQPGTSQTIQVTAGTTKLSAGHYSATLAISAGSQSMQVAVTLGVTVLQATPPPQQCPPGTIGTWPNCQQPQPQQCPSGSVGTPPNCQQPLSPLVCIQASTQSLSFSATQGQGDPSSQSVIITNCGGGGKLSVSGLTGDGGHWLGIKPTGGSLDNGASQEVGIAISNSLPPGTYTGHITFTIQMSSGTASITVTVTFTVLK